MKLIKKNRANKLTDKKESISETAKNVTEMTIEEILVELAKHGKLDYIHHHDDQTWSASMRVPTNAPTLTETIYGGFIHLTIRDALLDLLDRVKEHKKR